MELVESSGFFYSLFCFLVFFSCFPGPAVKKCFSWIDDGGELSSSRENAIIAAATFCFLAFGF